MENENLEVVNEVETNYIETIKNLKDNTVSRDAYNKIVKENKQLLDSLVNGGTATAEPIVVDKPSTQELRDKIFGEDLSNLEFVQCALDLRKAVLNETGEDIFVGRGQNLTPTKADYESAARVAEIYQDCIDYAQGDSETFTNELMRRTNDVGLPRR